MPNHKNPERVRTGRHGGLTSWANTDANGQRQQRMAQVRENSPAGDLFWAKKLGFTVGERDDLTPPQLKEIQTARKLYFAELRTASVKAIKHAKAERLRARADAIDAGDA